MSEPYVQCRKASTMDLLHPLPESVDLDAMAFSLGHLNRYTGHAGVYSVAEHLVLGTRYLADQGYSSLTQLLYLFHDAHEAYTGDVSQPVKMAIRALCEMHGVDVDIWKAFERIHQINVRQYLRLRCKMDVPMMKSQAAYQAESTSGAIDLRMLITETDQLEELGGRVGDGWPKVEAVDVSIRQWSGLYAYVEFLTEVERLAPELLS